MQDADTRCTVAVGCDCCLALWLLDTQIVGRLFSFSEERKRYSKAYKIEVSRKEDHDLKNNVLR